VITTVNVQHLESLNDVVAEITGVQQRETVPDDVVRRAEQVELVDMTPQALRRRMAHGHIYPSVAIDTALGHYFREGNLTALRELALLWVADQVDEGLERYRREHGITGTWVARERVVVALTGGEYDLLLALLERANRVLTRDMLLDLLRGRQAGPFDRAIDVAVSRLRRKLEDDGRRAQLIKTVRGGGYVLAATVERI